MSPHGGSKGVLIVFAGQPGTGKTTLSRLLAAELRAALVRVDALETALVRTGLSERPVGPEGYVLAAEVAACCLAVGTTVIVDAVNPVPEARAGWRELASSVGVAVFFVEVELQDSVEHRRRVSERLPDLEGQVVPTWEEVAAATYVPWDEERDGVRLLVSGSSPTALADISTSIATA